MKPVLNVQAFDKLIADVSNCDSDIFNMSSHYTCMLSFLRPGEFTNTSEAAKILGISERDCGSLFLDYPDQCHFPNGKLMPSDAVKVLLHYKDTKEVDWHAASR